MTGETRDYGAVTRHLWQCLEKSQSCPSLKQLSLDAVATTLWKSIEREAPKKYDAETMNDSYSYELVETLETIEEMQKQVLNDIKTLVPITLLPDLNYVLSLKIAQIIEVNTTTNLFLKDETPKKYFWTPRGRIDDPAIARFLIENKLLDDNDTMMSAIFYCLKDQVIRLWQTETGKKTLQFLYSKIPSHEPIFGYWLSFVAGKTMSSRPQLENILHYCICFGIEALVKYFWNKSDLNSREKLFRFNIELLGEDDFFTKRERNVWYFLMTRVTESQLSFLIESKPFHALCCLVFSTRPEVKFFMTSAIIEQMSGFLDERQWKWIVQELINHFVFSPTIIYEEILMTIWNVGSAIWRKSMIRWNSESLIKLFTLKKRGGGDLLIAMCKEVIPDEKERHEFLLGRAIELSRQIFKSPSVVEEFLRGFLPSEDSVRTLKRQLAEFGMQEDSMSFLLERDLYELYFDYCNLSDEEIVLLKTRFCCYEKLKDWVCFEWMSKTAIDDFSSWCLLSETESRRLRELSTNQSSSSSSSDDSSSDSSFDCSATNATRPTGSPTSSSTH